MNKWISWPPLAHFEQGVLGFTVYPVLHCSPHHAPGCNHAWAGHELMESSYLTQMGHSKSFEEQEKYTTTGWLRWGITGLINMLSGLSGDPVTQEKYVLKPCYHFCYYDSWKSWYLWGRETKRHSWISLYSVWYSHIKNAWFLAEGQGWDLVKCLSQTFQPNVFREIAYDSFRRHKMSV